MKISKSVIVLLVISSSSHADPIDRHAGLSLIQNFQCDNKGDATQRALDSLARTQSIIADIGSKEDACKAISKRIAELPDMNSIASRMRADATTTEIRRQEALINEAFADLSTVQNLPVSDPKRELYPDEISLRQTVQTARSSLTALRAQLSVSAASTKKEGTIQGITQLDQIAQEYTAALGSGEDCFKKKPEVRNHLTTGLLGIAGFFMQSPMELEYQLLDGSCRVYSPQFLLQNIAYEKALAPLTRQPLRLALAVPLSRWVSNTAGSCEKNNFLRMCKDSKMQSVIKMIWVLKCFKKYCPFRNK